MNPADRLSPPSDSTSRRPATAARPAPPYRGRMAWAEGEHILQLYPHAAADAGVGTAFVAEGLLEDATVVVLATTARWEELLRQLHSAGVDAPGAVADGRLRPFGAHGVLAAARPEETLQAILRFARMRGRPVRVISELTDLLWRKGEHEQALAMERRWSAFARSESFSLLCACGLDALDAGAYEGALARLGALHTHLVPVDNCEAFDDVVGRAVAEVLEPRLLRMVHALSATHRPAIHLPTGVALLFWLKQHMPRTAERVLDRSRKRWTAH